MNIDDGQLTLDKSKNKYCPFKEYIEDYDTHCYNHFLENPDYQTIAENSPDFSSWLSRIGGIEFDNITDIEETPNYKLPIFIPSVSPGSPKVFNNENIEFLAINLNKIYDDYIKKNKKNIRDLLGINKRTKLILFNYAKDKIIEEIWSNPQPFYTWVFKQNFDIVTGINYSIWYDQPHAERLINLKRGLISFTEMQKRGIPAIPHFYWFGNKDILRNIKWLKENKSIKTISLNLQTYRKRNDWDKIRNDLKLFVNEAPDYIVYLITGPSSPSRINEIKAIFPTGRVVFNNSNCARVSLSSKKLIVQGGGVKREFVDEDKSKIFSENLKTLTELCI